MSLDITAEFHAAVTKLEEEGHALAGKFRAIFDHYEKLAEALAAKVAPLVAADIKAVEATVVAKVEAEAGALKALIEQYLAAQQPPAPAPAEPPAQN